VAKEKGGFSLGLSPLVPDDVSFASPAMTFILGCVVYETVLCSGISRVVCIDDLHDSSRVNSGIKTPHTVHLNHGYLHVRSRLFSPIIIHFA
jgi:hypothetical protein